MCGIVAFTGTNQAAAILLAGLTRLEHRGYDSAGIAVIYPDRPELQLTRQAGKVAKLAKAVVREKIVGTCGIGHTRWATHGVPSEANAHPHRDCSGKIAVAHNGIIENYARLKDELLRQGHQFSSQTDTEVVAHLVEHNYNKLAEAAAAANGGGDDIATGNATGAGSNDTGTSNANANATGAGSTARADLAEAVRITVSQLSGSFALAILHADHPDEIVVTRNDSPLVLGCFEGGAIAASGLPALLEYTRDIAYIEDRDLAVLHRDGQIDYYDPAGEPFTPSTYHVDWTLEQAEKGGYPDFMLKEICEQPRVIRDTIAGRFDEATRSLSFDELPLTDEELANIDRIVIVACGTSYHAGLIGKDLIESWARIPVEVEVASEFRYRNPIINSNTLVIAISQSGETADTLEAVRQARRAGAHVIALTNVLGSQITREAQTVLYIKANLEIAVAATKSFLAQVAMLTLLGLYLAQERSLLTGPQIQELYGEMSKLPLQLEHILADTSAIERAADSCVAAQTALFIGRGVGATTCYEGALKLKEISYLHAEAFSAGEIKHGPIALIDAEAATPVIVVATQSTTHDKTLANIEEVKARGASVIAVATEGDGRIAELADYVIYIPPIRECFSPITASVPLQLFARHIALARGCDVDQPRNLAKSVTVE
ncbi:MAG: glutamine--fructose-6-phosphate transaminase (isomerizing) [Coriobacteriales bacterium]|jgi:glucosamine--fructose-6-phosphate aminotransferase (isomerizing)|nr:glutamine--fructose-6-phosphate transaminase (isomerizing) [Coriobacteriales bacterium]